jgi:hypothetical protein
LRLSIDTEREKHSAESNADDYFGLHFVFSIYFWTSFDPLSALGKTFGGIFPF